MSGHHQGGTDGTSIHSVNRPRSAHPIELESFRILRSRVDTACLPPCTRAVIERVIHTSADVEYADDLVCDESALRAGWEALHAGAPLIVDVRMLAAGVTSYDSIVALDRAAVAADGLTRSATGVRAAAAEHPDGAVWAIGNAPTALRELLRLGAVDEVRPALVVGLPVGFVDAAAAKAALRASGLPAVSNRSAKGGTALAAAAVNALRYLPEPA